LEKEYLTIGLVHPIHMIESLLWECLTKTGERKVRILAIGCRYGDWEEKILNDLNVTEHLPGVEIIGVDIDLETLKEAKSRIDVIGSDVRNLGAKEETFDIVYCPFVLHWLTDKTRRIHKAGLIQALKEMKRVLRKKGWLQIITPGPSSLEIMESELFQAICGKTEIDEGLKKLYLIFTETLENLLSQIKELKIIRCQKISKDLKNAHRPLWVEILCQKED